MQLNSQIAHYIYHILQSVSKAYIFSTQFYNN